MKTRVLLISSFFIFSIVVSSCAPASSNTTGNSNSNPPVSGGSNPNQVIVSDFAFSPVTLTVKVGTEVTWVNQDSVSHSVVSSSGTELNSQLFAKDASWSHIFKTPGTYEYHCGVHPTMVGTIIVTP